jgi:hypothetical protein
MSPNNQPTRIRIYYVNPLKTKDSLAFYTADVTVYYDQSAGKW